MERIPRPVRVAAGPAVALLLALAAVANAPAGAVAAPPKARVAATKAPVRASIAAPAAGATVRGRVPFTATAAASAGVQRMEFRIDGTLRGTDRTAPYALAGTWNTASVSDGTHAISVTAVNRRGRTARDADVVTVDNVAPPAPTPAPEPAPVPGPPALAPPERAPAPAPTPPPSAPPAPVPDPPAPDPTPAADPTPPPPVGTVASVFLSPSGNDANPCSAAAPCRTMDRGYRVAAPGQVVELAAGAYSGGIRADASKSQATQRVVMRPADGASVSVTGTTVIEAKHLELQSMAFAEWQTSPGAADVMFRNVAQRLFYINSSQQISLVGGSAGPSVNAHPQIQSDITTPPRDILIDGVAFHDFTRNNPDVHTECLQIGASDRLTIRNSTFRNCHATANIGLGHWGPSPDTKNVVIENNFFSSTVDGFYSIQANAVENMLIRNNSAVQGFLLNERGTTINVRMVANLAPMGSWECMAGVQYRSNVWFWSANGGAAKCHASDTSLSGVSNPGFVNPGALDLHLTASSVALGRGAATEAAVTDIDGQPRDGSPDAGADER